MNQAAGVQSFQCQQCGGAVAYDAGAGGLKCNYCGHFQATQPPPVGQAMVREIPIEEGMRMAARGLGTPLTAVECQECGATVNVGQGAQTVTCRFCKSHKVLPHEATGALIRPESMVPFQVNRDGAVSTFQKWMAGLWFRPGDLKDLARVEEMSGVYIPFWTFDAQVYSQWRAEAGYHYQEQERDSEGNMRTVTKTRWEHASGQRRDFHDDVIVCASKGVPDSLVNRFRTWSTKELVPYDPQYLAGWAAESYAIDLPVAWQRGQADIESRQEDNCRRDIPGDTNRNLRVDNQFSAVTFKHVLLPLWVAAFRYGDKPYAFLVNGQTGEVVGYAPWSVWKIALFILVIVAIITAIVILTRN